MRLFGPFEITATGGDKLFGSYDIANSGPIGLGMNLGSGPFTFSGGTGRFAGATGEGTMDVKTTLDVFPTTGGTVEQEWRGMITLMPGIVSGDYDQNGSVDAADYVVWRHTLGQAGTGLAADGDGSGAVDQADYGLWRANFGATDGTAVSLSTRQVPEARSIMLAALLFVLFVFIPPRLNPQRRRDVGDLLLPTCGRVTISLRK
jgi:hypothetical protein